MIRFLLISLVVVGLLLGAGAVWAQGSFSLPWWSVDGGGGVSSSQRFTVRGVAGQPDAGVSSGERFAVAGGFLPAASGSNPSMRIYLPQVARGSVARATRPEQPIHLPVVEK